VASHELLKTLNRNFVAMTEQHEAMRIAQSEMRAELARMSALLTAPGSADAG
jgi:hypothetical protein